MAAVAHGHDLVDVHDDTFRAALDQLFTDVETDGGEGGKDASSDGRTGGKGNGPKRADQRKKRRRVSRSERCKLLPMKLLPLPTPDAMTLPMEEQYKRDMADFSVSMERIKSVVDAFRQDHPYAGELTDLNVSTITFSCPLRGPHVDGRQLDAYLHSPACELRSSSILGTQMMLEDRDRNANFNNAVSVWLPDAAPMNIKSIKFFYPRPSLQITGSKSISECFMTAEYARRMLVDMTGGVDSYILDMRAGGGVINMINTDFVLGFGLKLEQTAILFKSTPFKDNAIVVRYKSGRNSSKERNFGVHLELPHESLKVSVKIFHTGSVLINSTSFVAIQESHAFVTRTLLDNRDRIFTRLFGRTRRRSTNDDGGAVADE